MDRDDLIAAALPVVARVARGMAPHPAVTVEELESAGHLAVVQAAGQFDPARGVPWEGFAGQRARWAMLTELSRRAGVAAEPLRGEGRDGHLADLPADPRASDPADIAAVRETVAPRRRGNRITRLSESLPPPDAVAERVTELRAAMYGRIGVADAEQVMDAILGKAKAGNVGAAKLVVEMLSPSRGGTKVIQQQAVIVNTGDLD